MTENKPIIIDGVNVAGCEFHSSTPCSELCYMKGNKCNDNPNCYFKQLARETQECEELKERLNSRCFDPKSNNNRCISYNRIAEDYERDLQQLDQLKAENEIWKNQVLILDGEDVTVEITQKQFEEYNNLKAAKEQAELKLEKIKDKCNETLELMNKDSGTNAYAGGRCTEAGQILQIIKEMK